MRASCKVCLCYFSIFYLPALMPHLGKLDDSEILEFGSAKVMLAVLAVTVRLCCCCILVAFH